MKKIYNLQSCLAADRFTIYKILFLTIFTLYIVHCTLYIPAASAADSTPSSELKLKLKALQEEIASRAAELKLEIGKKLQNKAFYGPIKLKTDSLITLTTTKGDRNITFNEFTEYSGKDKPSLKNLSVNNFIVALGDIDDHDNLAAKKIIRMDEPKSQEKVFLFGQVVSVEGKIIQAQTKDKQFLSLSVDNNTSYRINKETEASLKDIKINKPIIVVGLKTKTDFIQAKFIYLPSYGAILKPKTASPSAVIKTASPSATPTTKKS